MRQRARGTRGSLSLDAHPFGVHSLGTLHYQSAPISVSYIDRNLPERADCSKLIAVDLKLQERADFSRLSILSYQSAWICFQ